MKIFIDSADLGEIKKYMDWGICDGVTTNPTICLKCGVTGGKKGIKKRTLEIINLVKPRSVSVEVTTEDPKEAIKQAKEYQTWSPNIAVKVTITDSNGESMLPVIYELVKSGIRVNVTAMMTFNQAILAAKAINAGMKSAGTKAKKPHFISLFAGRISEEQGTEQAMRVLEYTKEWLGFHEYKNIEIIVGSVRTPENVEFWARSGADILTIPPAVIAKSLLSARTKETVIQFIDDAKKALDNLK
jgi:transaldolase